MGCPGRHLVAVVVALAIAGAGCGDDGGAGGAAAPASAPVTGEITVLAAASLTAAFDEIGIAFEHANPGAKVTFSFASSSALATQVNQGAPADVFASADTATMDKVTGPGGAGTASAPVTFARNSLQIIVGKGNPKGINAVADLAKPGVVYVTAAPGVPIGRYAQQALEKAKVSVAPRSLETDVKAVVAKVALGEADAGIVYATDVKAAGNKAQGIVIPDELNVVATYPMANLKGAKNATGAAAFVSFVISSAGQAILKTHGFSAP
jgi:molybdate transport system substrate-binding protein